ncbi:MAG: hypothetical protein M1829_005065 [Trizodia sp. TS-e1964]|nr:MAG: hypothetical protein M1829_005065 [Trizodia sp. TS-e1964]
MSRVTLIRQPPLDPSKSSAEDNLELTPLTDIGPNLFTNTRPLWHPPGARGIYGGAVIAQCLSAAQQTVPEDFTIHSMHCYFVLAGNSEIPIIYAVEHVREGKSFATRTVQARQRGKCIFTTTMSFMKEKSAGKRMVEHTALMPKVDGPVELDEGKRGAATMGLFVSQGLDTLNENSTTHSEKRTRHWMKALGKISPAGGHQAHLSALAYMSDSYFIGTIAIMHRLLRSPHKKQKQKDDTKEETITSKLASDRPEVGIMVSLDHSIYFHSPRDFRADEWLFAEIESPWAGDGRGLVSQRIFTRDGRLVASCFQEGLVRLKQDPEPENELGLPKSKL